MKKLLAVILTLALCIPFFSSFGTISFADESEKVYMITTSPAENCETAMNVGWFADADCTESYVLYTLASDTEFANASQAAGVYDAEAWKWFEGRYYGETYKSELVTEAFLDYGATLEGLTPDTDYIYKIADGKGGFSKVYSFKTAGADEFSMMWISDYHLTNYEGTTKTDRVEAVVDYLEGINKYDIGGIFSTGDAVGCGDRVGFWQTLYDLTFMDDYMYFATVGNHDLYDSMMDDVSGFTSFWQSSMYFGITANYPKNGYTFTDARITAYLTDTGYESFKGTSADVLTATTDGKFGKWGKKISGDVSNLDGRAYWFIYNRVLFIVFDYYALTYLANIPAATTWVEEVLEENKGKYDYLIGTQHVNLYNGDSGTERAHGSSTYYKDYQSILDTFNFDIFFAGDNHIYFRSDSIYNHQVNTDPEKGTYILQAPAITNTSNYGYQTGAAGVGVNKYSAAAYMGGAMLDFDADGIHFKVVVNDNSSDASTLKVYDEFTIPKKPRYIDRDCGYYMTTEDTPIYETTDVGSTLLTTIPKDTMVQIFDASGKWAKMHYDGFSGWAIYTEDAIIATDNVTYYESFASNYNTKYSLEGVYVYSPAYGATIANGGYTFGFNAVLTAMKREGGYYEITEINAEQGADKSGTATGDDRLIIMLPISYLNEDPAYASLKVGYTFTNDYLRGAINTATIGETNPTLELPFKVTFVADGETVKVEYVNKGEAATAPEAPVVDGYDFIGWDKAFDNITAELTVTAEYKKSYIVGDASGDGLINPFDASLILRLDAMLIGADSINMDAADVSGDGLVNPFDASLILRYDAMLLDKFPVELKEAE